MTRCGPPRADVVEGDAVDLVRLDGAAALLGDEVAQVRGGEAEGGVAGELGLADRQRLAPDPRPVHVTGGEPPGLKIRRHEQHPVVATAEHLPAHRVQRGDLGDDVPAQRRVAAADHVDGRVEPVRPARTACGRRRVFSATASASAMLRVLVRMKQVEPGPRGPRRSRRGRRR